MPRGRGTVTGMSGADRGEPTIADKRRLDGLRYSRCAAATNTSLPQQLASRARSRRAEQRHRHPEAATQDPAEPRYGLSLRHLS